MSSTSTTWTTDTNTKSGVVQIYTSNISVLRLVADEGTDAILDLFADQGDDNADKWRMWASASDNDLHFSNYTSGTAWTDIITLQDGGNVGIGTSSPTVALDVTGAIKASTTGTFGGALTCVTSLTIGSAVMAEADLEKLDDITDGTAAANKAVVLDGSKNIATLGTVACGVITQSGATLAATYSPIAGSSSILTTGALDTGSITSGFGNIDNGASSIACGSLDVSDGNITNVGDIALDTISSDAGTSIGVTLGTDAGDDFNVGSGKLVVEGDTGKVGIGTAAPGNNLEVSKASSSVHIEITAETDGYDSGLILTNIAATKWQIYNDASLSGVGDDVFCISDDDGTNRLVIRQEGYVGIGHNLPIRGLHSFNSAIIKAKASFQLTGSVDVTGTNTNVPGSGTEFTKELTIGDRISISGEDRYVTAIGSDTSATAHKAWGSDLANDTTPTCNPAPFSVLKSDAAIGMVLTDNLHLGIGTAAPESQQGFTPIVHIEGSGNPGFVIDGGGTRQQCGISSDGAGLFVDASGHATASNNNIYFRTEESNSGDSPGTRMLIDHTGLIGMGTQDPNLPLTIVRKNADSYTQAELGCYTYATSATTHSLIRFGKSNSNTVANVITDDNDVLGAIIFQGNVGTNAFQSAGSIECLQDGARSGDNIPAEFLFKVNNGSSTINPMVIRASGQVGIGAVGVDPDSALEVNSLAGTTTLHLYRPTSTTTHYLCVMESDDGGAESAKWRVEADGDTISTTGSYTSDERIKKNIVTVQDALSKVNALRGTTFEWKYSGKEGTKYGLIAQEVEEVIPELVRDDGLDAPQELRNIGVDQTKVLNYTGFIPVLVEAIKELSAKVEALENA